MDESGNSLQTLQSGNQAKQDTGRGRNEVTLPALCAEPLGKRHHGWPQYSGRPDGVFNRQGAKAFEVKDLTPSRMPDARKSLIWSERVLSSSSGKEKSPGQMNWTRRIGDTVKLENRAGFKPANNGFAIRPLRPLGHLSAKLAENKGIEPSPFRMAAAFRSSTMSKEAGCAHARYSPILAETQRFELWDPRGPALFENAGLSHSPKLPCCSQP